MCAVSNDVSDWDDSEYRPPPALGSPEWLAAWRAAVAHMSVRITGPIVAKKARAAVRSSRRRAGVV
jgi:hypothetical protein